MAVSKIWSLKNTMDKAVKYICNHEKTWDGTLIRTYQCTEQFADYEFKDVADKARKVKNARLGYHAMVSFSPEDDITPERALELGEEIFSKYTGGNHQYVLAVHTDQDHLHVHCIFNSVSFDKYRKFHIDDKDINRLEKITDKVCKENGLSVIEKKSGVRGHGKYEHMKKKENKSWKYKLQKAIDRNILQADSYEDFLNRMQYEEGYQIKQGKFLSFMIEDEGQLRSTRNRSLGDFYSIDSIKYRIEHKEEFQIAEDEKEKNATDKNSKKKPKKIEKLIDVGKNKKAQEHTAYRKKLNMANINTYAGMINFVKKYHLVYAEDFEKASRALEEKSTSITEKTRKIYSELNTLEADAGQYAKYLKSMPAHAKYIATNDSDIKFQLGDANKNYESAKLYFKKNNIEKEEVTEENLNLKLKKINLLRRQLDQLKAEKKEAANDLKQLQVIEENNRQILGKNFEKNEGGKESARSEDLSR